MGKLIKDSLPNPGSPEAIKLNCKCPVIDNHHGKGVPWPGYDEPQFWVSGDCPVHGGKKGVAMDRKNRYFKRSTYET